MAASASEFMSSGIALFVLSSLLTIVMAVVGYQQTQISKLDQRIYELQATAVTESKMTAMEQRITSYVDKSVQGLSNQQAITNKYLEVLMERGTPRK